MYPFSTVVHSKYECLCSRSPHITSLENNYKKNGKKVKKNKLGITKNFRPFV